jgi:hypothetical protein
MGIQCVRVHTARGWVVIASDTTHYYEHCETGRCFGTVFDVGATIEGYDTCARSLITPAAHHSGDNDPLVMSR